MLEKLAAASRALLEKLRCSWRQGSEDVPEVLVSAAEFMLEGLHAHKRIGRNEERVFTAEEQGIPSR